MIYDKRRNSNGLTAAQQHVLDNAPTTPTTLHDILATIPHTDAITPKSRKSTIKNAVLSLVYYKKLAATLNENNRVSFYKLVD